MAPADPAARGVKLSSGDRVLFADDGITKGDLFDYYGRVADVLVPHLRDRPFTMKRWREGLAGDAFFQKQAPKGMPSWIPTRQFQTWPREGESRLVDFPLVDSREAVLWMVQMHCIDMNAWYSRIDKPDRPDFVLFDLDPPDEPDAFQLCVRVAHYVRAALTRLGLESWVKTSGADGIHVVVPIARRSSYAETYEFAELLSRRLEAEHPGEVTTEWLKKKRAGVLVDHRQNGWGKTIASVYSVRPKPGAPVSTPLRWEELTEDVRPRDFSMSVTLERVAKHGDLFEPVLRTGPALGPALRELRDSGDGFVILAVDWITVSSLGTAGATLVLAFATFGSVRSANRAARAAERSLMAGIRPVLMPSNIDDAPLKVGFMDDKWFSVPGSGAVAEVSAEAIYLAMSLRNMGSGIAVLDGWYLHLDRAVGADHMPLENFRRLTRDLYIAPSQTGFWQGVFRDPAAPEFAEAAAAINARQRMSVEILYGDHEGGQRTVTLFGLIPREDGSWIGSVARHWNIDRPGPR